MAAANKTVYDDNNRPKITKDEVDKGMLNMIYKGLIPKFADLTPGFQRNGCPIKTTTNMRDLYGKRDKRDEVETESVNNIKYNFDQGISQHGKNFFLTDKPEIVHVTTKSIKLNNNNTSSQDNQDKIGLIEQVDIENKENSLMSKSEFNHNQE